MFSFSSYFLPPRALLFPRRAKEQAPFQQFVVMRFQREIEFARPRRDRRASQARPGRFQLEQ